MPKEGDSYNESHADEEVAEEVNISLNQQLYKTGYPDPDRRFRLVYEDFNMSLEELYFWSINHIRQDFAFPKMVKITDIFSASENSAMFGQSAQRLSIQEDRASNFLRGISELVRTLFQIVRELRIIDERMDIYDEWKNSKSADATLKGLYADFAENKGGQMQPGSIYSLANQVGYQSLPDLFFNTHVYSMEEIDEVVGDLKFNTNVKSVLRRKLTQFLKWKENTHKELKSRRKFQIKYLRQHYLTIKTYMAWVKPYLRHIKRLQMNEEHLDSADIISSFETSMQEIEVLAIKPIPKNAANAVVVMNFKFKTRPVLQYQQERSRGPVMVGRGIMTLRSYAWTDEQIENYKKLREEEEFEMMGLVDSQLEDAMDLLGDELQQYLREARGEKPQEDEEEDDSKPTFKQRITSEQSALDPFISIYKGFKEIGTAFVPGGFTWTSKKKKKGPDFKEGPALNAANLGMWMVYNNYKKAHSLLSW